MGTDAFAKKEWPIFFDLLKQCYKEQAHEIKRIKFEDISTAQTDISKLAVYLERNVHDDTCVIVASCPGGKMDEVEPMIAQFKRENKALKSNVQLGYCERP